MKRNPDTVDSLAIALVAGAVAVGIYLYTKKEDKETHTSETGWTVVGEITNISIQSYSSPYPFPVEESDAIIGNGNTTVKIIGENFPYSVIRSWLLIYNQLDKIPDFNDPYDIVEEDPISDWKEHSELNIFIFKNVKSHAYLTCYVKEWYGGNRTTHYSQTIQFQNGKSYIYDITNGIVRLA